MATRDYLSYTPDSILNKDLTSNYGKLWQLFSDQLDELVTQKDLNYYKYVIADQSGVNLDQIGKIIKVDRAPDQADAEYRISLYAGIISFLSSGSIPDILDMVDVIKASGESAEIIEFFPGNVQIYTNINELIEDDLIILNNTRAAGIGLYVNYSSGTDEPFVLLDDNDGLGLSDIGATGAIVDNSGVLVEIFT